MADIGYSEEDVNDWVHLPMISNVITSTYFGAWLYYRDKRRDKIVNSKLLDKVGEYLFNSKYASEKIADFDYDQTVAFTKLEWMKIVAELKDNVE